MKGWKALHCSRPVMMVAFLFCTGWMFQLFFVAIGAPVINVYGTSKDKARPWRIWSGDACRPCSVTTAVSSTSLALIASCVGPCALNLTGTEKCTTKREEPYKFTCECKPGYSGKFCEKQMWKKSDMEDRKRESNNNILASVIAIGNESDFYYECHDPVGKIPTAYFTYRVAAEHLIDDSKRFECPAMDWLDTTRCIKNISQFSAVCEVCQDSYGKRIEFDFTEQHNFWDLFWEPYETIPDCTNIIEKYKIFTGKTSTKYITVRDNSNCDKGDNMEKTFRGGCRGNDETCIFHKIEDPSNNNNIKSNILGQRCKSCDKGIWGDKCQYIDECEWWSGNTSKCPSITDNEWKRGPCGVGGTCISRANGKFCLCPPGKLDGFVSIYTDRVKDTTCSPAGNLNDADVLKLYNDEEYDEYSFFLEMSPFHTYRGCQIDDPCEKYSPCQHAGWKQIVGLVDEDTKGFQTHSRMNNLNGFRFHALEVNLDKLKCKCNCRPGHSGDHCEIIDPCHFETNPCRGGTCHRIDNENFKCDCLPPYYGERCKYTDRCEADNVCESVADEECYYCDHKGVCKANRTFVPYEYSCDCSTTSYVGETCNCSKGEVKLKVSNPNNLIAGEKYEFEVVVTKKGDSPFIVVDMGDGFHFPINEIQLKLATGGDSLADHGKDTHYYKFPHTFDDDRNYSAKVYMLNCDDKDNPTEINRNPIYLSDKDDLNITVKLPPEFSCLPEIDLKNVGHSVDTAPNRLREKVFTVETALIPNKDNPECNITFGTFYGFKHKWTLHKLLNEFFPVALPENKVKLEDVANDTKKHLTFDSYKLGEGLYVVKYAATVTKPNIKKTAHATAKGYFEIVLSPPKIVIPGYKGSVSKDVSKEVVLDASTSYDPSYPTESSQVIFAFKCEQPIPCNLGPWEGSPIIKIPAGTLIEGVEYVIHLDVSWIHKEKTRKAYERVSITAATGSLQMECVENCERMNPEDEILVHCGCRSCETKPKVTFEWEPSSDSSFGLMFYPKDNKSLMGIVLPKVDNTDDLRREIICTTRDTGLVAKLPISVNKPPVEGDCGIEPNEGIYLITTFTVECEGYLDEDEPLEYTFYAGVEGDIGKDLENQYMLSHDTNPNAEGLYLPYNPSGGDTKVVIKVTDRLGLSVAKTLTVFVTRPDADEYPALLKSLIFGNNSLMKTRNNNIGDKQGALQLQLAVLHGLLDNQFQGLNVDEFLELRTSISHVLSEMIPLANFKAVEQTLNTLYLLKQWGTDETFEALQNSSTILFNSAKNLSEIVQENTETVPTELVGILARAATDSSGRILKETYEKGVELIQSLPVKPGNERKVTDYDPDDEIGRDYFFEVHDVEDDFEKEGNRESEEDLNDQIQAYAKMSHDAYAALEHLLDAVGERLEDGHNFSDMRDDVAIHVKSYRELPLHISPIEIKTQTGENVKLDIFSGLHDVLKSKDISHMKIQVTLVDENPFFDDTSAIPGTPIVSVVVKDRSVEGKRLPIVLDGVEHPFEFRLPLTLTASEVLELSKKEQTTTLKPLNMITDEDIKPFYLILPYNARVEVTIQDFSPGIEFIVVVKKDFWMVKQDFCDEKKTRKLEFKQFPQTPKPQYSTTFNTESLSISETPEEHFLEYYVGIFAYEPGGNNVQPVQTKYSVYFTRTSCLFLDENRKFWSEEGCIVANDTSPSMLHCICRHASIFAGTQFAIPNSFPEIRIFNFDPDEFERNPILLTTVCVCLTLYISGMIICWYLDRRDKRRHVGITIMADLGDNLQQSYYLINVWTGSRFGAGTTADVCMQIYGSNGRSQVYILKEKSSPVLNRGGLDTFLVSSVTDLGELEKIRIWHDNTGSSPTWFCRKVVIKNIKSSREWYFFVYRWMQISGTESTIIVEQNSATEQEHKQFKRRFRENLADQFDNAHLWLSLFRRPAASRFTRCQRLSCAFAILTSYMLINIMFYDIELVDPDDIFGLNTYIYGLQLTIYALPFGLVIVNVFRRIRERYLPTLIIWKNLKSRENEEEMKKDGLFVPQTSKIHPHKKNQNKYGKFGQEKTLNPFDSSGFDNEDSDVSSNFSIPSTNIEDLESWLASDTTQSNGDELPGRQFQFTRRVEGERSTDAERIALGRIGLVHAVRAADPHSFVFSGSHDVSEMEHLIDEEIKAHLLKSGGTYLSTAEPNSPRTTPVDSIPIKSLTEEDVEAIQQKIYDEKEAAFDLNLKQSNQPERRGDSIAFETCEMEPVAKALCYLPWWFIYIAWILCLGTILCCLYLTLLYGLEYGYLRSVDWLLGITTSFLISLFIMQPLQILIAAVVLTLLCRSKHYSIIQEERFQLLIKDEDYLGYRRPLNFRVFHPERKHPPLSGQEIFALKVEAREREKLKNAFLKLLFYCFILIPLIIIAYSGHSKNNFQLVNNLRTLLKLKDGHNSATEIKSDSEFFHYMENTVLSALHPDKLYNGDRVKLGRFDPVFLDDGQNLLVGVPRIRQVRIREEACNIPEKVMGTFSKCYDAYKISKQDTESYDPLWHPMVNGIASSFSTTNNIWRFRNETDTTFMSSIVQRGEMGLYYGGGYVAELGRRWRESVSVLRYLRRARWIDHRSRGIFIEFSIFNPNVNIYADVMIMVERSPTQAFHVSHKIQPLVLSSPDDLEITPWLKVSYGMLIVCTILLFVIFFWNLFGRTILRIYYKPWFWLDLIVICGIIISLGIALKRAYVVTETLEHIENMKHDEFVSLQLLAYWSQIETAAFSICLCVCLLKIWRILILIDERFLITSLTIKVSSRFLVAYFIVLAIILVAFASGGHFIFGNEMEEFRTFGHSMVSLIDQIVSVDFFSELATTHSFLGPVYSFVFGFFVVFLALNLLISLLNQGYYEGRQIAKESCRRWTYKKYLKAAVYQFFSWKGTDSVDDKAKLDAPTLQPHRLEGMKRVTAQFFRDSLNSSEARTLSNMKNYANDLLQGTGYHMVSKISRKHQEELVKESRIDEMRLATIEFLKQRMGTEMDYHELENYAALNRVILGLRIRKLEQQIYALNKKLDRLMSQKSF